MAACRGELPGRSFPLTRDLDGHNQPLGKVHDEMEG